jgi:hypothetical protein
MSHSSVRPDGMIKGGVTSLSGAKTYCKHPRMAHKHPLIKMAIVSSGRKSEVQEAAVKARIPNALMVGSSVSEVKT